MSTHIENGYKLPAMDAYQLRCFITNLREALHPIAISLIHEKIAEDCMENIDDIVTGRIMQKHYLHRFGEDGEKASRYALERPLHSLVEDRLQNRFRKIYRTKHRDPSYDFQFSVVFMPMVDAVYAMIFTEQKQLREAWEGMKGVAYYGYWNSTDPPKDITYEQFSERGRYWDDILRHAPPMKFGLQWELLNTSYFMIDVEFTDALEHMPNRVERSLRIAKQRIMRMKMKEYQKQKGIKKPKEISDSGYFAANEFCRTDVGKQAINELSAKLLPQIVPITEDVLKMNYKQIVALKKRYR